jgi:hypothetical protein
MDPFTMAKLLLGEMPLTSGQLAQLRALSTRYYTELQARAQRGDTGHDARADADELAAAAREIREMLTPEQQAVLDRNLPRLLG